MKHMNEYDILVARSAYGRGRTPNRLALVMVIDHLADWANANSDGWAYWAAPRKAAQAAIELVESKANRENERREREDISDEEMHAAVAPIERFLRQHADKPGHALILRSVRQ